MFPRALTRRRSSSVSRNTLDTWTPARRFGSFPRSTSSPARSRISKAASPACSIVAECRRALEHARQALREGAPAPPDLASRVGRVPLEALLRPSLGRVINATGVILHTNLGRAPLSTAPAAETYSNLEYDLHAGRRGKRDAHTAVLLHHLLDAPAILVNNAPPPSTWPCTSSPPAAKSSFRAAS